jgi:hypothetical protein
MKKTFLLPTSFSLSLFTNQDQRLYRLFLLTHNMEERRGTSEVEFLKRQPKYSRDDQEQEVASMDKETLGRDPLSITPIKSSIQDPKAVPGLWYKIHVLIYDLRNFQANSACRERLETVIDASYFGSPYFTPAEATIVKSFQVSSVSLAEVIEATLKERLERRMKKRVYSGDFRVCAAHDVAPILEKALGVKGKDLMRDKEFLRFVENWGLEWEEGGDWKGIQKKNFAPKQKGGRQN